MAARAVPAKGRKGAAKKTAETPRAYASPACLMHEVDPAYFGFERADEPVAKPGRRRSATGKRGKTGKKDKNP